MSEQKMKARRKLLKGMAAGGGAVIAGKSLPDNWGRPVVDSVMLPAHAQTSLLNSTGPGTVVNVTPGALERDSMLAGVAGSLLPEANAGLMLQGSSTICIEHIREGGEAPDVANFSAMATYGPPGCEQSMLITASNVPANPAVNTPANTSPQCQPLFLDAREFFEGLLPSAHAGPAIMVDGFVGAWVNLHTLTGPSGGAFGYFGFGPFNFKFDLPRGDCAGLIPVCGTNCIGDGIDGRVIGDGDPT
jgi:hypothetical protein